MNFFHMDTLIYKKNMEFDLNVSHNYQTQHNYAIAKKTGHLHSER